MSPPEEYKQNNNKSLISKKHSVKYNTKVKGNIVSVELRCLSINKIRKYSFQYSLADEVLANSKQMAKT